MLRILRSPWLKRLARIWSIVSLITVIQFIIGGLLSTSVPSAHDLIVFPFFPIGVSIGLVISWWREGLGGLITTVSAVLAYGVEVAGSDVWMGSPFIILYFLPGVLFFTIGKLGADE